jgi:DNA-binding CsgD family transcriptional regulator
LIRRRNKFGLTDRELAMRRLIAEGKPNAEIGVASFISTKTASVHVTNIPRKLGGNTRVQAATVAERTRLLAPRLADHWCGLLARLPRRTGQNAVHRECRQ